ncbi:hypothetical protein LCGC14_2257340, partial [marine sediment metagenome]
LIKKIPKNGKAAVAQAGSPSSQTDAGRNQCAL